MKHQRRRVNRTFVSLAAAVTVGSVAPFARAQAYPSRVVRIVVAFPPGGATDQLARLVAGKLTTRLGQSVIVENRPSPSGIVGTDNIAKGPADGYTLLFAPSLHATNVSLFSKLPYDTEKDFAPIVLVATTPYLFVTHPSVPAKSVRELIDLMRRQPGTLNISASAVGSPQHLAAELFRRSANVDVVPIHYKGSGAILPDLISGRVQMAFENQAVVAQHVQSGALNALAVTGTERSAVFPNVPTMIEGGVEGFRVIGWFGLVAAAKTPPEIIQRLNVEVAAILKEDDVLQRFATMGATAHGGPPAQLGELIGREIALWRRVITEANIRLD